MCLYGAGNCDGGLRPSDKPSLPDERQPKPKSNADLREKSPKTFYAVLSGHAGHQEGGRRRAGAEADRTTLTPTPLVLFLVDGPKPTRRIFSDVIM